MNRNVLQQIFLDHYEEMIYTLHPRASVIENVDRMLSCGDPEKGFAVFGCEQCGTIKRVPFRCHSRFCPSCGVKYTQDRVTSMSFKVLYCKHRHLVFTIPEELRHYFLTYRTLLSELFHAVRSVILRMFDNLNHKKHFVPGFICVLHTFGRDLKWNPHIHVLLSEGGVSLSGEWQSCTHFNYHFLLVAFRTALLNMIQHALPVDPRILIPFRQLKAKLYGTKVNGFYVRAKPTPCKPDKVIKYIGRYLGRPAIATSRIDSYDGDNVTFHYKRHEDDQTVTETIPVLPFIARLIRHIPDKHFKMIRYYGIYARHLSVDDSLVRAVPSEKHNFFLAINKWRASLLRAFGFDPVKCPCCGQIMVFQMLVRKHQHFSLQDLFQQASISFQAAHPPPNGPLTDGTFLLQCS